MLLAERNAASNFATRRSKRDDAEAGLEALHKRLHLSRLPRRIECYDVSHIQGSDPVASMVVFVDGVADNKSYRHFKIKGLTRVWRPRGAGAGGLTQGDRQNDDFRSMYEVLNRRFRRALDDEDWALPDLIVIDGGKGQLGRVIAAMQDLGVALGDEGVDIISLAKERRFAIAPTKRGLERLRQAPQATLADYVVETADQDQAVNADTDTGDDATEIKPERVFVPKAKDAIALAPGSSELYLLTRIRDEAHRFAITHHRKRRGKRSLVSVLDGIKGVGPSLKKALIQHFGSIKAIKAATVEELVAVDGVGPKLAEAIHAALR